MRKNNNKKDEKSTITFRLNEKEYIKLKDIMRARDLNQSDAIRFAIMQIPILHIGNVKNLAEEFCKIRHAMNSDNASEEVKKEVNKLCHYIFDLITKIEQ